MSHQSGPQRSLAWLAAIICLAFFTVVTPTMPAFAQNAGKSVKKCTEIPWHSFKPRSGKMRIEIAKVTFALPNDWHFITAYDQPTTVAHSFLSPTCREEAIQGYLLGPGNGPTSVTWRASIRYHDVGYVSIEDAIAADFDTMLSDLRDVYAKWSVEQEYHGKPPLHVTGWAIRPGYTPDNDSMVWSIGYTSGSYPVQDTEIKLLKLGRYGYLDITIYTSASEIGQGVSLANSIANSAIFDTNMRHSDVDENSDTIAPYTVGKIVSDSLRVMYPHKIGSVGHWKQGLEKMGKRILYFIFETMFWIIGLIVIGLLRFFREKIFYIYYRHKRQNATLEVSPRV